MFHVSKKHETEEPSTKYTTTKYHNLLERNIATL